MKFQFVGHSSSDYRFSPGPELIDLVGDYWLAWVNDAVARDYRIDDNYNSIIRLFTYL